MPVSATITYYIDGPFMPAPHMRDTIESDIAHIVRFAATNPNTVHTFVKHHCNLAGLPMLAARGATAIPERFVYIAYCSDNADYAHITQIDMHSNNPNPT